MMVQISCLSTFVLRIDEMVGVGQKKKAKCNNVLNLFIFKHEYAKFFAMCILSKSWKQAPFRIGLIFFYKHKENLK